MSCNPCPPPVNYDDFWIGNCPECNQLRWYPGEGNRSYKVPGFIGGKPPLVPVDDEKESELDQLKRPKRTRLISKYRYGANSKKEPEHIEYILGLRKPSGNWKKRLEAFREHISDMGLSLSQLVPNSKIKESEPLLLHWSTVDPFEAFPTIQQCTEPNVSANAGPDPNWGNYELDLNMHPAIFDSEFREHQLIAIKQILKNSGSRQIVALPTGYGKTRIVQSVTNILRNHKKGPTLMITPIIALRDDQREAFDTDFKANSRVFNREFKGAFITPENDDVDEVIDDLINDRLDILCCAPEHLLNPSKSMSWIEIFQRMKRPFSTLVVDEAHVVGDWGSSFRSHFLLLGELKDRMVEMEPDLRVILQSATITKEEEKELTNLFDGLSNLETIRVSDTRQDLYFSVELQDVENSEDGLRKTIDYDRWVNEIWKFYEDMPGLWRGPWNDQNDNGRAPLLIYSATKIDANEAIKPVLIKLAGDGGVEVYDGDTDESKRDSLRRNFKQNKFRAMVATSAFGMGIDKPDVWLISYLGLPFTLKGLYQGFGRAARGSNWKGERDSKMRNGCCIAVLPDVNPSRVRPFRPELRIELAAERLWDLLMSDSTIHIKEEGYVISPVLDGLYAPLWMQKEKSTIDYYREQEFDEEDEEDDTTGWNPPEEEWMKAERRLNLGRISTMRKNLKYKMWSLACLQRKNAVSILGFYPQKLVENTLTGDVQMLEESLRQGGHIEVTKALKSVDPASSMVTPSSQKRDAVIRFNQPVTSWREIISTLIEGHDALRERHQRGNKELSDFMTDVRNSECLRKAFGPAIGAEKGKTLRCETLLDDWINQKKHRNDAPPIPCSNCLKKMNLSFSFSEEGSPLWLDSTNMRILRGDPELKAAPLNPMDAYWVNTGRPKLIFKPKDSNLDQIEWKIPKPIPKRFFTDEGMPIHVKISKLSKHFIIKDVPLHTGAFVTFHDDGVVKGRFVDKSMVEEVIEKWENEGVRVVEK